MKRDEILQAIRQLAQSQWLYGRLLESIETADEDQRERFLSHLEAQNFTDVVDLVIYLES